jgi:hypothetical protein
MERLKTERAGVAAGEKMLVEDSAYVVSVMSITQHAQHRETEFELRPRFMTGMAIGSLAEKEGFELLPLFRNRGIWMSRETILLYEEHRHGSFACSNSTSLLKLTVPNYK